MSDPVFTSSWFKSSARYTWEKKFLPLAEFPLEYLEVGVYEGRSSHWMLSNVLLHEHSHAALVDPWLPTRKIPTEEMDAKYQLTQDNLKPFIDAGKCTIYRDLSQDRVPRFPDAIFDLGYCDGDHLEAGVRFDAHAMWAKLKPGGVLIFDDCLHRRSRDQVALVVKELFLSKQIPNDTYWISSKQAAFRKPVNPGDSRVSVIAEYTARTADAPGGNSDEGFRVTTPVGLGSR